MNFEKILIDCQDPKDNFNIIRKFATVKIAISKGSEVYKTLLAEAKKLSLNVSSGAANESALSRDDERKLIDSFGGLLAEKGWEDYINSRFDNIASSTPFTVASKQIDIKLTNGELLEVRSSFIRNGVKFGICSKSYNFKNIGPYSNSIKPSEMQKNMYCGVLFETQKTNILSANEIIFYLVGSSTWDMMLKIGVDTELNAWDAIALAPGKYKVVYYKDSMDLIQLNDYIESLGYTKK